MFSLQDIFFAAEDLNKIVIDPSLTVAKAIPCDVEGALGSLVIMVMIIGKVDICLFVSTRNDIKSKIKHLRFCEIFKNTKNTKFARLPEYHTQASSFPPSAARSRLLCLE